VIPPGTRHKLWNLSATDPLVLLRCCAPAYSDEDAEMLER
jgi:mannose-6-phosphate isomerase-like protein (cupin superfamily)